MDIGQGNGMEKTTKNVANKAKEEVKKMHKREVRKKIIAKLAPVILKIVLILILILLGTAIISWIQQYFDSEDSKEAEDEAIVYDYSIISTSEADDGSGDGSSSEEEKKGYKIIVDTDYGNHGYGLTYQFCDEDDKAVSEAKVLEQIKEKLDDIDLDPDAFTDSELKIIATLDQKGVDISDYVEEELQCLALFVKANIAGQSFDIRPVGDMANPASNEVGGFVDIDEIRENDFVYGTVRIKKVYSDESGVSEGGYMQYKDYATYNNMVNSKSEDIGNYFTLDDKARLIIASADFMTTEVTYEDIGGNELPEDQVSRIPEKHRKDADTEVHINKKPAINYKSYISKYLLKYDVLTDLLLTTQNTDFCSELTALAFNGHITIVVRAEYYTSHSENETTYTEITAIRDYVDYDVSGTKTTTIRNTIDSGKSTSVTQIVPSKTTGWRENRIYNRQPQNVNGTLVYEWTYNNQDYQMTYNPNTTVWVLSKINKKEVLVSTQSGDDVFVKGGYDSEFGEYTEYESWTFKVKTVSDGHGHTYKIDIAEIDTWFARYDKFKDGYGGTHKVEDPYKDEKPEPRNGKFVEKEPVVLRDSEVIKAKIADSSVLTSFVSSVENKYKKATGAEKATCTITELTIKESNREDKIEYSESNVTRYRFDEDEEEEVSINEITFKNLDIVDNKATFTDRDKDGFLYLYDIYSKRHDIFLTQDAENKLFTLLNEHKGEMYSYLLKVLLSAYDGVDRGASIDHLRLLFQVRDIVLTGGLSPFGCRLERDEFIELATKRYGPGNILGDSAADFYDVCLEYNINPCLAFAWAVIETGGGTSDKALFDNNLFGMGVGNEHDAGISYDTPADSIRDFCGWVKINSTPGTNPYSESLKLGTEYATVNEKFDGDPDKNIYVLFCRYAFLGKTHICDDPNCTDDSERFKQFCKDNNSNWGSGGRYIIYHMYELGGLYNNEYDLRCGHLLGTDPTTIIEQSDYVEYTVGERIKTAKGIFGNDCFYGSGGIVESAFEVAFHYIDNGPVYYAGDSVEGAENNGRVVIHGPGSVQKTWDIVPDGNTAHHGIVCATFVSLALWKAETVDEGWLEVRSDGRNRHWHATSIGEQLVELPGWICVGHNLAPEELVEGDVIVYPDGGHIYIYIGKGQYIDQNYCTITSEGKDYRGHTGGISMNIIGAVYRYELE